VFANQPDYPSELFELKGLWTSLREAGHLPPKSAFTPKTLRPWLPHIAILDVEPRPLPEACPRFRIRLMGTATVRYFNGDYTGRWLDECTEVQDLAEITKCLAVCIATGSPLFRFESFRETPLEVLALHQLYLPCTNTEQSTGHILCGIFGSSFWAHAAAGQVK